MGSIAARPTRREQRREQTVHEIRALAIQQVAADGPDAVSLNGIARTMAMSPAAVYRYFDSRDALLADLVVIFYDALADALEAAAGEHEGEERFVAVARAYRRWALDHPNPYRLIFHTTSGSGQDLAPERTIPAASRSMNVILTALAAVSATGGSSVDGKLDAELRLWAIRSGHPEMSTRVLALGLTFWTRLHGVVSLEIGHHLASTGVDPALLYEAELRRLVHEVCTPP